MKKVLFLGGAGLFVALFALSLRVNAEDLLQGDQKYACEAMLCLSSGKRPSECEPSLRRYFSIKARKPGDTLRKRRNFLKMCPETNNDRKTGTLADAIAYGAGRCDAKTLNRTMRYRIDLANEEWVEAIGNRMPSYCADYYSHEYTDFNDELPRYVGIPERGGFWVESSGYETALASYNRRIQEEDERERRRQEQLAAGGD